MRSCYAAKRAVRLASVVSTASVYEIFRSKDYAVFAKSGPLRSLVGNVFRFPKRLDCNTRSGACQLRIALAQRHG